MNASTTLNQGTTTQVFPSLDSRPRFSGIARFALLFFFGALLMFGWDAGPSDCKRNECSGGKVLSPTIPDTQPKYANSILPSDSCPAGTEWYGSGCYKACPANYHRTAVCTCVRNNAPWWDFSAIWTDCGAFGYASFPQKTCPADREYYAGLCYSRCPAGSVRTAISTCSHSFQWRGNTHLWVVNRALDLLANSPDPAAKYAAGVLRSGTCNGRMMDGIWDADDGTLADSDDSSHGSHFYNAAGRDAFGSVTSVIGYLIAGFDVGLLRNAKGSIRDRLKLAGNLSNDDQCREMGLALHYLTDLTQPMHSASLSALQAPPILHPALEDYVPAIQARFTPNAAWDRRWVGSSPDSIAVQTSTRANGYAPGLMKLFEYNGTVCSVQIPEGWIYTGRCFLHDPAVDAKIGELLQDAYQSTASFIYSAVNAARAGTVSSQFDGQLINDPATGTVYFVTAGSRKAIPDPETFNALGFSWGDIKTNSAISLVVDGGSYPHLQYGKLPRNPDNGAVYVLEKGFRRHVPDINTFNALGLSWENVVDMSPQAISSIPEKSPMPQQ